MVKKSVGLIVLGAVLVAAIPAAVLAQGMLGDPHGSFPSLGGQGLPGGLPVGPPMPPPALGMGGPPSPVNFCPPPCPPPCPPMMGRCRQPAVLEPTVYVGYLYKHKGGGVQVRGEGPTALAGIHEFRLDHDMEGIWLEATSPIRINDFIGLAVGGSYFFPTSTKAKEIYRFDPGLGTSSATRRWQNDLVWWTVQGALSYNLFSSCSPYAQLYCPSDCMPPNPCPPGPSTLAAFTLLGGLRWDAYRVNLSRPSSSTNGFPAIPTDQAEMTMNSLLPFFGAVVQRVGCNGMVKLGAVGFPALPGWLGEFNYGETIGSAFGAGTSARFNTTDFPRSGYFVEAFAEAGLKIGNGHLGGFVKYFNLHGRKHVDLTMAELGGTSAGIGDYIFSVDRRNWVFGGRLSFLFSTGM
jgi:hypothetical protein